MPEHGLVCGCQYSISGMDSLRLKRQPIFGRHFRSLEWKIMTFYSVDLLVVEKPGEDLGEGQGNV